MDELQTTISKQLAEIEDTHVPDSKRCAVWHVQRRMTQDGMGAEFSEVHEALMAGRHTDRVIQEWFAANGYPVPAQTLSRHRRSVCSCR